jgi:hypothetical protein
MLADIRHTKEMLSAEHEFKSTYGVPATPDSAGTITFAGTAAPFEEDDGTATTYTVTYS